MHQLLLIILINVSSFSLSDAQLVTLLSHLILELNTLQADITPSKLVDFSLFVFSNFPGCFEADQHLGREDDWVEFVLLAHHHVEDRDEDSHGADAHTGQEEGLLFKCVLGFVNDDQLEDYVDGQLREVLCEE